MAAAGSVFTPGSNLPLFTFADIVKHNRSSHRDNGGGDAAEVASQYIVIGSFVYDIGRFLKAHPGGEHSLLHFAESDVPDATTAFMKIHSHPAAVLAKHGRSLVVGRVKKEPRTPGEAAGAAASTTTPEQQVVAAPPPPPPPHPRVVPGALTRAATSLSALACDAAGLAVDGAFYALAWPALWAQRKLFPLRGDPVNRDGTPTRVAVIGAGAAGLSAAWCLHRTEGFDFTVFEKKNRLGGHAYPVPFEYTDKATGETVTLPVDIGFIFGNHRSYSNLLELMQHVGAEPAETELSVSVEVDGQRWCTSAEGRGGGGATGACTMHPDGRAEVDRFHGLCDRFADNATFNMVPFGLWLSWFGFARAWRAIYLDPALNILFLDTVASYNMSARFMFNVFGGRNKFIDLRHARV